MTCYRQWLNSRGVPAGPWVVRDTASCDRSPQGEDPKGLHAKHESAVPAKQGDAQHLLSGIIP